ncbi:pickpocket 13 [Xylocopa sonorina]|uniref:pickpocket 13 n=1 Tax=Xylocopa sonorina TaxID=1818115 RepID=UPI00403B15C0
MKRTLIWWWKIIKQYLRNCSIHGVKYLVDDQLSCTERLFWLIFCILSWVGCARMIVMVLKNFTSYPVALIAETFYTDWQTPFPAVAFCISSNTNIKKYFKGNPGLFTNYSSPKFLRTSPKDLQLAYDVMRIPCPEILGRCTWNNVEFNCCTEFQELRKTGVGYCIAMNTVHLKKDGKSIVHYFVNRTVMYGDLIIDIRADGAMRRYLFTEFTVHVFNNLQLPMFENLEQSDIRIKRGRTTRVDFTMVDTFNDANVRMIPIAYRKCRFFDEVRENNLFDAYSSQSCFLELVIERMIQFCGCVHFYYFVPRGARVCNATETQCIIANKMNITMHSIKDELCLTNCDGTKLSVNSLEPYEYDAPDDTYARVHFTLLSHPVMRYRRYVVTDRLDIIVSVGSAIGLFIGASILSIFEIPYWLFVRRDKIMED